MRKSVDTKQDFKVKEAQNIIKRYLNAITATG